MKITATIVLLYALLILIGGIFGHQEKGSIASLISGIVFGTLLFGASLVTFKGKIWGEYIALILIFLLDAFFTYRFIATHKFMPAGLLSLISLGTLFIMALIIKRRY